jgi:hypothetical protein
MRILFERGSRPLTVFLSNAPIMFIFYSFSFFFLHLPQCPSMVLVMQ